MRTSLGWAPEIPDHWEVVPLNAVAKMGTGHTPDRSKPEYWENCTIPWVTTPDVTRRPDTLDPLIETEQSISQLGSSNSAAVVHPPNTVMLSRTASVGYSVVVGRPMATTQAFVTWEPGPRLDPRYLLLVIRSMKPEWERLAYGSTHLTIYMPDLESLRIPLPPLEEQEAIANFVEAEVESIDKLLDIRDKQKRLLSERLTAAMERCVTDPEGRADRILGKIPDDWTRTSLGRVLSGIDVGVVVNPSSYFQDTGVPFIHGFNVRSGWIDVTNTKYVSDDSNATLKRSQIRAGDVLVVRAGAPGRAAVVPAELDGANCASVLILRQSDVVNPNFLSAFLNGPPGAGQVKFSQYGAAQEVISAAQVSSFRFPLPPLPEQNRRVEELRQERADVERLLNALTQQCRLTRERRGVLIRAAVSGQTNITTPRRGKG